RAATAQKDELPLSQRSLAWWLLFMPGKVILWFGYMFPTSVVGSFAGARRRNVPAIQLGYTLLFYAGIAIFGFMIHIWIENGKPNEDQRVAAPRSTSRDQPPSARTAIGAQAPAVQ